MRIYHLIRRADADAGGRWLLDPSAYQGTSPSGEWATAAPHQALLEEITGSGAWLRLVWESAPDAMALSDPDGIVLLANPAYCALYGFEREEIVGASFAIIFPEAQREAAQQQYRQVFQSAARLPAYETWIRRKDGTERFVQSRAELVIQDGRPRAMLSIIRDMTERKRTEEALQEREARLHLALTLAPVFVFTQDTELRYTWAHTSMPAGPDAEAVIGRTDAELLPPEEAEALTAMKRRVIEHGERVQDEINLTVGPTRFDVSFVSAPLYDSKGAITGLIAAAIDISDYRTLERQQRQFIAMAAHELRTPVTSILGFAQLLQRRDPTDRHVNTVVRQAASLDRLINDLIDSSRLEDGRLELQWERFDLVDLARDVVEQIQPLSEAHPMRIDASPEPLEGEWDRERLGQVLQNLLTNAIKYSPGGGSIAIVLEDLGACVRLRVRDQGVGIPPGLLPRLFDPFYRVEKTSRLTRGLGLGLHISRSLVEAHGGTIEAESAGVGAGSTFTVTLPREQPPEP